MKLKNSVQCIWVFLHSSCWLFLYLTSGSALWSSASWALKPYLGYIFLQHAVRTNEWLKKCALNWIKHQTDELPQYPTLWSLVIFFSYCSFSTKLEPFLSTWMIIASFLKSSYPMAWKHFSLLLCPLMLALPRTLFPTSSCFLSTLSLGILIC